MGQDGVGAWGPSQPESTNTGLIETEVVANLVTHRLVDVQSQALRVVPVVAHERVAKNQDLVWNTAASKETSTAPPGADVEAVRVVLGAAV